MLAVETLPSLVILGLVVEMVLSLVVLGMVVETLLSVDALGFVVDSPVDVVVILSVVLRGKLVVVRPGRRAHFYVPVFSEPSRYFRLDALAGCLQEVLFLFFIGYK